MTSTVLSALVRVVRPVDVGGVTWEEGERRLLEQRVCWRTARLWWQDPETGEEVAEELFRDGALEIEQEMRP